MEDLDFTQSSEAASEYDKLPHPDYENILVLIEHLRMEYKDSSSLLKIQDTVHSYKRLVQLKNSHCDVLIEKNKTMENKVSGLHKKLSETEHEKMDQEQELCNLRFALKQEEEKRKNAEWVCEKMKERLREKEEQCDKEAEMKQQLESHVRKLDVELKTVRNKLTQTLEECNDTQRQLLEEQNARRLQDENLVNHLHKQKELEMAQDKISSELQEALDQSTKSEQCAKKMQDCIQKLGLENYKLKVTVTKQAERIEQLKENLVNENLNDDLTAKLETASSKYLHLHKENQLLQQELLSMKSTKRKCEQLREHKKKLEQEIVNLKSHMEKNMIECGQVEQYKWEIEEKTKQDLVEKLKQVNLFLQVQAAYEEKLQQLRNKQNASIRSQMDLRIRDLESEFSKMKNQVDCNKIEMENYKQLYLEEVKIRKSLSNKLSKTDERLAEVKTELLLERRQNRPLLYSTLNTRPALESICPGDLSDRFFISRSFSRENLVVPTSNLWHSIETMPDCKNK
uniref:Ankyrin repeat domain-containing protein 26-like n=2 Tax=Nannospalax galili TaxID=1026970 RepID=A0A8C6QHX2_NANGA